MLRKYNWARLACSRASPAARAYNGEMISATLLFLAAVVPVEDAVAVHLSAPATVAVGKPILAKIALEIPEGFHIYAADETNGIPTEITWAGSSANKTSVSYPTPTPFESFGVKSRGYSHKIEVPVTVNPPKGAKGKLTLRFKVTTQSCNDTTCLPPQTVEVSAVTWIK